MFSRFSCWFEPLEISVQQAKRAYEGLIKGGDLATAGYAFVQSLTVQADCAPTLDVYLAEVDAALAFARSVGIEQMGQWLEACRRFADVLRGETAAATAEAVPIDRFADNPTARFAAHFARAITAAIFDDPAALKENAAVSDAVAGFCPG